MRFVVAGAVNTSLGLSFYPAILWLVPKMREHYLIALGISQAVCLTFAFFTYKLGVFRAQGKILGEFFRFSGFYLVNYAANWVALPALVEGGGADPFWAQLAFTAIVVIGSYFWHTRITFAQTEGHD